jgi:hypothetical protein
MSAVIATRTPEGVPGRCPACEAAVCVEPSWPTGDAPCPRCGTLVWFDSRVAWVEPPEPSGGDWLSEFARGMVRRNNLTRWLTFRRRRRDAHARRRHVRTAPRPGARALLRAAITAVRREVGRRVAPVGPGSPYGDVSDPWLDG